MEGIYIAEVSRLVAGRPWVLLRRLSTTMEYGPLLALQGAGSYAVGDQVLVAPLAGRPNEFVVLGRVG